MRRSSRTALRLGDNEVAAVHPHRPARRSNQPRQPPHILACPATHIEDAVARYHLKGVERMTFVVLRLDHRPNHIQIVDQSRRFGCPVDVGPYVGRHIPSLHGTLLSRVFRATCASSASSVKDRPAGRHRGESVLGRYVLRKVLRTNPSCRRRHR